MAKKEGRIVYAKEGLYDKAKTFTNEQGENLIEHFKKSESSGGGTPIAEPGASPKGYNDGGSGRGAMKTISKSGEAESERKKNQQPRTDDGKFTHNDAAGKGLSSKSDPNRAHTVSPLLTGGKEAVESSEFIEQLKEQKGEYWEKFSKIALIEGGDYVYRGKIYTINRVTMAEELLNRMGTDEKERTIRTYEREKDAADKTKPEKISKEKIAEIAKDFPELIKNGKIDRRVLRDIIDENGNKKAEKENVVKSYKNPFVSKGLSEPESYGVFALMKLKKGKPKTDSEEALHKWGYNVIRNVETNAEEFMKKSESPRNLTDDDLVKIKLMKEKNTTDIQKDFEEYRETAKKIREQKAAKAKESRNIREQFKESENVGKENYRKMVEKYEQEKLKNKPSESNLEKELESFDWSKLE